MAFFHGDGETRRIFKKCCRQESAIASRAKQDEMLWVALHIWLIPSLLNNLLSCMLCRVMCLWSVSYLDTAFQCAYLSDSNLMLLSINFELRKGSLLSMLLQTHIRKNMQTEHFFSLFAVTKSPRSTLLSSGAGEWSSSITSNAPCTSESGSKLFATNAV